MSILIKGMEMPKCCAECEWHEYYSGDYNWVHACRRTGTMPIENAETERANDCPLIEVPTSHGRLIDADEFEREFNNHFLPILVKKYGEEEALKGLHFSFRDCICNIQCQKTVIEGSDA